MLQKAAAGLGQGLRPKTGLAGKIRLPGVQLLEQGNKLPDTGAAVLLVGTQHAGRVSGQSKGIQAKAPVWSLRNPGDSTIPRWEAT